MRAWWENFQSWFGALEPLAQIGLGLLAPLAVWLIARSVGRPPKAVQPPSALASAEARAPQRPKAPEAAQPSAPPRRPPAPAPEPEAPLGEFFELSPDARTLVGQALGVLRGKAERERDAALAVAVAEAEEGRGAPLVARVQTEYDRAPTAQFRAEAAWRLGALLYAERRSQALALFREATEAAPHQAAGWLGLAMALRAGDPAKSAEALTRAEAVVRDRRTKAAILAERARQERAAGASAAALRAAEESVALWRPSTVEAGPAGEEAQVALAAALGIFGEAASDFGDRAQARKRFAEAAELTAYLATRRPSDAERALAAGAAADRLAEFDEAQEMALRTALVEVAGRAAPPPPYDDSAEIRQAAVTAVKIGDALRARGSQEEAYDQYAEALAGFETLARRDSSSATARRDRAMALERLGDAAFALGDLGEARARYEANLRLREAQAAAAPAEAETRRDLALALIKLADLGKAQGEPGAAQGYELALALARGLARAEPRNVASAHLLALALDRMATLAPPAQARARYEEIRGVLRPLDEVGLLGAEQTAMLEAVEAHLDGLNEPMRA